MNIDDKIVFSSSLNSSIIRKIGIIEKFQGRWEALRLEEQGFLGELRHIATIQSIGSSTRIEGSTLNDKEVEHLIESLQVNNLETRDEQEVVGYWETLELLTESAGDIDLSERSIFQLHGMLLRYSEKDTRQRGGYKSASNRVVASYPDGTQRTIFNTTEPHMVSKEMCALIIWVNNELKIKEKNPLIVIASFVYEFLSIHPFHDGNGRLSRLLTTLLLIKEKYYFVQFVSFEHVIETRKKEYYQALMECQKNRHTVHENMGLWVDFFLDCMIDLSGLLEQKLNRIVTNDVYMNERQKRIVQLFDQSGKFRTADVANVIEASLATIKKDLKYLVDNGVIKKSGAGKATTYTRV